MNAITFVIDSIRLDPFWLEKTKAHPKGIEIMLPKARFYAIHIYDVPIREAIILKEECLSKGMDCSVSAEIITLKVQKTDVTLFGTEKQIISLIEKLKIQPFSCKDIALSIEEALNNYTKNKYFIRFHSRVMEIPPVRIMGILNATPDSFYTESRCMRVEEALEKANKMIRAGVDILDVGGESSRPFSQRIDAKEELERVIPIIDALKDLQIPISIDTYKPIVAEKAIEHGAEMINDISGFRNREMINIAREYEVPVVIMHMKGRPENMQNYAKYKDIFREIYGFLKIKSNELASILGKDKIVIDPGIGFGKSVTDNYLIIKYLNIFRSLGYPILIGTSRKSFIGKVLDKQPEERLFGTIATLASSIIFGASILRVHDVGEARDVVKVMECILEPSKTKNM